MKILMMDQGSAEWLQARQGVVTASEINALVTPLFKPRTGEGVETYLAEKLCEKLIGWTPDVFGTFAIDQGKLNETTALPWYNFSQDASARKAGFCLSDCGRIGCSPDGLVGDEGGLEIKSPRPPMHLKTYLRQEVPDEYLPQVHFSIFVTGRAWWDYLSFSRQGLPNVLIRVQRDEAIIAKIKSALYPFLERLDLEYNKLNALKVEQDAPLEAIHKAGIEQMRDASPTGELAGEQWLREKGLV